MKRDPFIIWALLLLIVAACLASAGLMGIVFYALGPHDVPGFIAPIMAAAALAFAAAAIMFVRELRLEMSA